MVDYCLNIIKHGFNVYVLPVHAYHRLYDPLLKEYFKHTQIVGIFNKFIK
jgi:hypothetical protein